MTLVRQAAAALVLWTGMGGLGYAIGVGDVSPGVGIAAEAALLLLYLEVSRE